VGNFLPHVAARIFGTPLLIQRNKLDTVLQALGPRIGVLDESAGPVAFGPGDAKERKPYHVTSSGIAVINVSGTLVRKGGWMGSMSGLCSYAEIEEEFLDAATDPEIKGILLEIDSPGGEAGGVFDLSDHLYSQRGSKPIYAVANDDAFSAAYAIASAADRIFVTRTGGVGSIGVLCCHVDQSGWDAKTGVKYTYVFAGAHKIEGNPHEPLSTDVEKTLQQEIDRLYDIFVTTTARNRGMTVDAIKATEAACYYGPNGITAGLADELGTFADALQALEQAIATPTSFDTNAGNSVVAAKAERKAHVPETTKPATQQQPAAAASAATEPVNTTSTDDALEIVELCHLAGKDLNTARSYLRQKMSPSAVRKALSKERERESSTVEIQSGVMPETGTSAPESKPGKSSLVQMADERAADSKKRSDQFSGRR
jgi:signal peptide peptidase SppA